MKKAIIIKDAALVLAVIALVAMFQKKVAKVPVIGDYLPGGM
jgi:hypothetical protein